jgi:hypothetical protein
MDIEKVKPATLREIASFLYWNFDVDLLLEVMLALLSFAAIAMIASSGAWHRWGFVVGLASQPFWILATWRARSPRGDRRWGMFVLSCAYLFVWIFGIGERFPKLF